MNHDSYSDDFIADILGAARVFAFVGASANTSRPSYFAMKYLLGKGYGVIPINPSLAGQELLGQKVYGSLAEVPGPVDVVDIFRSSDAAPGIVREAIALKDKLGLTTIWMQLGVRSDEAVTFDQLAAMPLNEMAFKEAMRLRPPVPSIPRRAMRDFSFKGYDIPAGTLVGINPLFSHHMPDIWPDPDTFDPMRFTDEAQRTRHRFAWVAFGGGAHMCLGLHFAYMQAKCFARHFLQNLNVALPNGTRPDWQMWPIPKPRDGLRLHLSGAA